MNYLCLYAFLCVRNAGRRGNKITGNRIEWVKMNTETVVFQLGSKIISSKLIK